MKKDITNIQLYKFENLAKALDNWGYPKINFESGFQVIKGVDFEKAFKAGQIRFEDDGIYLDYEGKSFKGYMFIREPYIEQHGTYPKFHILKCRTIQEFLTNGNFNSRYDFSNSEVNDLVDKTSRNTYKDEELQLCSYCKNQAKADIKSTRDFHELFEDSLKIVDIEIDIFGYTRDWDQLSKAYRSEKNYTCEDCGLEVKKKLDRRYIHVHHINGDKTANSAENLKCLCILCHSNQDELHRLNFSKGSRSIDLQEFKESYKNDLMKLGHLLQV